MAAVHTVTFTPVASGRLRVSCTYDVQITAGSDWGTGVRSRPYVTQNGTTTFGQTRPASTVRVSQEAEAIFDVAAGQEVSCGLDAQLSGAVSGTWWNVNLTVELRKR